MRRDNESEDALGRGLGTLRPPGLYEFHQEPANFHCHANPLRQALAASDHLPQFTRLHFAGVPITAESKTRGVALEVLALLDRRTPSPAASSSEASFLAEYE